MTSSAPSSKARGGRRSRWWVALLTFVLGAAVGVIAAGLLSSGVPESSTAPGPTATPAATVSPQPSPDSTAAASAEAQVNAACLRVIQDAQDVYEIIAGVGEATADVDLQRLDDMVRRLQPIEPRLQRDLQECHVDTSAARTPGASSASPTPVDPQESPTATPTG